MNAFNRIRRASTMLDVSARADLDAEKLRDVMQEVATDLDAMLDEFVERWGELRSIVRRIENE